MCPFVITIIDQQFGFVLLSGFASPLINNYNTISHCTCAMKISVFVVQA